MATCATSLSFAAQCRRHERTSLVKYLSAGKEYPNENEISSFSPRALEIATSTKVHEPESERPPVALLEPETQKASGEAPSVIPHQMSVETLHQQAARSSQHSKKPVKKRNRLRILLYPLAFVGTFWLGIQYFTGTDKSSKKK